MDILVNTPYGKIKGISKDGMKCFLGVPYAKPPIGDLRFRAPQPVEPWDGVLSATQFAKDPIQSNLVYGPEYYSEDCLYLNIWVPNTAEEKKPVMLWIPGGAFATGGSGAIKPEGPSMYDGEIIARDTGCIVVTMSYRLNVFGFLNLSSFSDRFDDNIGMKDILMAMRWVYEAIESFGGDRNNITLFGESAGAEAISAILLIKEAQPYYHKAILESNCFESFYTVEEEREICELYLKYAGLDKDNAEGLLTLSYEQLLEAGKKLGEYVLDHYVGRCTFCPVVDGELLSEVPTLASFESFDKPVLIGSNRNEGNFQMSYVWTDPEKYATKLLRRLTPEDRELVLSHYPKLPDKQAFGELLTDVMYALPKIRFAEHLSRGKSQVYVFRFDYYTPVMESLGLYACHVAELLPLFELQADFYRPLYVGSEETVHQIGVRMRRYWGQFARTGNPNMEGLVEWKPYTEQQRNTLLINVEDKLVEDAERVIRERYAKFDRILL